MGRPMRGSRQSTFYSVDESPSLATLDSAFQLQEYIAGLVRLDPHDVQRIVDLPGAPKKDPADAAEADKQLSSEDERPAVDEACWIYEQLRRLAQDLTHPLITTLQQECTRQTCPEMKAGEWLYLCVAHGNSGGMEHCCAIDYIVHTLDSATALLNSPRAFPSRISIPVTSHRHFPSLARRLGRIFAHAYYHHRAAFESAEAEGALYARFLALARRFDLVPPEFLVIPARPAAEEEDVPRLMVRKSPEPAPSPRRPRSDTMYLSEGGPGGTASPRRMPSPRAETLRARRADDGGAGGDVLGMSRVIVRDFALSQETQGSDQTSGVEAPATEEDQREVGEVKGEGGEREEGGKEKGQEESAIATEEEPPRQEAPLHEPAGEDTPLQEPAVDDAPLQEPEEPEAVEPVPPQHVPTDDTASDTAPETPGQASTEPASAEAAESPDPASAEGPVTVDDPEPISLEAGLDKETEENKTETRAELLETEEGEVEEGAPKSPEVVSEIAPAQQDEQ